MDEALRPYYGQKGFAVANLVTGYAFDRHLSLNLALENVFDKRYGVSTSVRQYGPPRNLMATLRYRF